jgi:hypothetical protein
MANPEKTQGAKDGTEVKPQRDAGPTRTSGSKGEEHDHGVRNTGSVGRDVPDQSKERNTEIAAEAGRKGPGEHHDEKR